MIDAKTALKMTEEVRQKGKNDEVWDKIEKKIISRINAGKQFCEVEVFSDSPISKNEIVERLTSLGYNVTETTYNIDELAPYKSVLDSYRKNNLNGRRAKFL